MFVFDCFLVRGRPCIVRYRKYHRKTYIKKCKTSIIFRTDYDFSKNQKYAVLLR